MGSGFPTLARKSVSICIWCQWFQLIRPPPFPSFLPLRLPLPRLKVRVTRYTPPDTLVAEPSFHLPDCLFSILESIETIAAFGEGILFFRAYVSSPRLSRLPVCVCVCVIVFISYIPFKRSKSRDDGGRAFPSRASVWTTATSYSTGRSVTGSQWVDGGLNWRSWMGGG